MPTYQYACQNCGHELEAFQSMKDAPLRKCPKCKKMTLQRVISGGAGIIFKGTGFYETDYKSPRKKEESAGGDASSDSKPASDKKKSEGGSSTEKTKATTAAAKGE